MWGPVVERIRAHQRFLLTTHVDPDADAIGCEVALAEILRGLGKETAAWNMSPTPRACRFLDPEGAIRTWSGRDADLLQWAEIAVILDTNSWSQLGEVGAAVRTAGIPRVVIDHHRGGDPDIGDVVASDPTAAATAVLLLDLARALAPGGVALSPRSATALFAALLNDTGSFRFANADPRAFETAAALVRAGARPAEVYREVFERKSWGRARLLPLALASVRSDAGGRVAWMTLTREMFRQAGATDEDADRFVDEIRIIRGVEACAVFRETEAGEVKATLRSAGSVDVQSVASRFGGGGHRLAAGATLPGPIDAAAARVVSALKSGLPADPAGEGAASSPSAAP
jgi:phosphoesterase RecJ-like protein